MEDPYEVLGIGRSATLAQAEDAYRSRLQAVHPDRHGDADAAEHRAFAEQTQVLNEAIRQLRYELREVREVGRCAACGAPGVDLGGPCPVCHQDPGTVPWWRESAGEHAPGALPSIGGSVSADWSTTPRGGNAVGPIVLALVALAAFALVFWFVTNLPGR